MQSLGSISFALRALLVAALAALVLGGCESNGKKIDYKSAVTAPSLEIPPGLTTPTYDDRYQATTASGVAAAKAVGRPSEILPPNADARLVRSGSQRWIVVKTTPDAAWNVLRDFWTQNGFVLAIEQPQIGIMETDWAENKAKLPKGPVEGFIDKYASFFTDTYVRDKFRSRIERGNETATVEIYISHRGAEQMPTTKISGNGGPAAFVWVPTPPNPELEAEFLERLMVKFGTPAPQATQAVAGVAIAPDRARLEKVAGGSQLIVDDDFDRAWRRVGLALDRTGFTVVDRDRSKGLYFVRYADPDSAPKKEGSWWSKLEFWKSEPKDKPEQYRIVVTQANPTSVVTVQDPSGVLDASATSEKILALLQNQLK
jgi:outer membrane protein assembly factor BamC